MNEPVNALSFPVPSGCSEHIKVRLQLTRTAPIPASQSGGSGGGETAATDEGFLHLEGGRTALLLAPPQAIPFHFASVHTAVSRVHFDLEYPLFEEQKASLKQLMVGINTAFVLVGHDSMKRRPHAVLDGWLSKVFKHVVTEAKRQYLHHDVVLRCQMVACLSRGGGGSTSPSTEGLGGRCYDLLCDPTVPGAAPHSARYAPSSTYGLPFQNTSALSLHTPEDGVNAYVMGLHNLLGKVESDRTQNADFRLEETTTVFCLEVRQEPRSPDADVFLCSRLFIVDLPSYSAVGTGEGLTRFFLAAETAKECYHNGRSVVNTLPLGQTDTATELLVHEGLLGGNCATEVVLFFEERAGLDQASTCRLLERTCALSEILSTPLLNDSPTLLHTTRTNNALVLLRHICTEGGQAVPVADHEKTALRFEASEERLRGTAMLLAERLRAMEAELIDCEREKAALAMEVAELRESGTLVAAARAHEAGEMATQADGVAAQLAEAKAAHAQLASQHEALQAAKTRMEDEYVNLRANYLSLSKGGGGGGGGGDYSQTAAALKKALVDMQASHVRELRSALAAGGGGGGGDGGDVLAAACDGLAATCLEVLGCGEEGGREGGAPEGEGGGGGGGEGEGAEACPGCVRLRAGHVQELADVARAAAHLERENERLLREGGVGGDGGGVLGRYEDDIAQLNAVVANMQQISVRQQASHVAELKDVLKNPSCFEPVVGAVDALANMVVLYLGGTFPVDGGGGGGGDAASGSQPDEDEAEAALRAAAAAAQRALEDCVGAHPCLAAEKRGRRALASAVRERPGVTLAAAEALRKTRLLALCDALCRAAVTARDDAAAAAAAANLRAAVRALARRAPPEGTAPFDEEERAVAAEAAATEAAVEAAAARVLGLLAASLEAQGEAVLAGLPAEDAAATAAVRSLVRSTVAGDEAEVVELRKNKAKGKVLDLPGVGAEAKEKLCHSLDRLAGFRGAGGGAAATASERRRRERQRRASSGGGSLVKGDMTAEEAAAAAAIGDEMGRVEAATTLAAQLAAAQEELLVLRGTGDEAAAAERLRGENRRLLEQNRLLRELELKQQAAHVKNLRRASLGGGGGGGGALFDAVDQLVATAVALNEEAAASGGEDGGGEGDAARLQDRIASLEAEMHSHGHHRRSRLASTASSAAAASDAAAAAGGAASFEEFLAGPYRSTLVELEEFRARATRAEAERDTLEESFVGRLSLLQAEKLQLQNDLAIVRADGAGAG